MRLKVAKPSRLLGHVVHCVHSVRACRSARYHGIFDVFDDFFASWMAGHPRRTGEAYWSQFWEAQFITENPVPRGVTTLDDLVAWFEPILAVERARLGDPLVGP